MSTLAGARLEEMADIRATRKKKIVFICSSIAATCLVYGALVQTLEEQWGLCLLHSLSALACFAICYMIKVQKHHQYADLLLSSVLMLEGLLLLLFNDAPSGKLLWLYPIVATLILINEFKVGLLFSCTYILFIFFGITFLDRLPEASAMIERRFMLTLMAIAFVCHTFSYYYAKILSYIQTLYREGIEELAYFDQLTGLANRWSFETWARHKLHDIDSSCENSLTALIFLDLDNFKHINDNYGHDVGDHVLKTFASRLKDSIRMTNHANPESDYSIARFAGDEFVLLLHDVPNEESLDEVLKRIVNVFSNRSLDYDLINEITMSVGVAIYKQDANELSELLRCADKAMYVAKHTGKNQYAYYEHCTRVEKLNNQQLHQPEIGKVY
ncbi:GGDEF domain-containing protein [Vibrio sp. EA2]|uniref:GGDEF domain-containing protein n=1 Tax=Vibrio sp. EA2 TaxID=3079860 RepID=UPI002948CA2D|nr:GGDEF domain-containing protein [Vibrio sp. EA2]MDV6251864.1 GGDEF domain-containing protein [Vibrio sp. EA2]